MTHDSDMLAPVATIEEYLERFVMFERDGQPAAMLDAVRYATLGAGKRLRPLLAWWSAVAVGGMGPESLPAGAAVELIHSFSLVHDDLPALDNDDLRRGKPTLHRHAGEAMAILAGDQILIDAFHCILDCGGLDAETKVSLCASLRAAAASMVYGQVYDTLGGLDESTPPFARVQRVHELKTGALIAAACDMGARCVAGAGTGDARGAAISRYGNAVGLMFQAVDDLIDVTQPAALAGKRTGKDAAAGKLTYPGVLGIDGTRSEIERLRTRACAAAASLGEQGTNLVAMANSMAARTK